MSQSSIDRQAIGLDDSHLEIALDAPRLMPEVRAAFDRLASDARAEPVHPDEAQHGGCYSSDLRKLAAVASRDLDWLGRRHDQRVCAVPFKPVRPGVGVDVLRRCPSGGKPHRSPSIVTSLTVDSDGSDLDNSVDEIDTESKMKERLVDWVVKSLLSDIKNIVSLFCLLSCLYALTSFQPLSFAL